MIAYASRSLKPAEKNYPAHKLEFLALKWSVCEKFHDYLYGATFLAVTDNNPLTYILTTAKLDATGQRWVAELSNYNFELTYRSGKKNLDADALSRQDPEPTDNTTTMFPEVLGAISFAASTTIQDVPLVESLSASAEPAATDEAVPDEILSTTSLTKQDWKKAQRDDHTISLMIRSIESGQRPTALQVEAHNLDSRYFKEWDKLEMSNEILFRRTKLQDQDCLQLVLPHRLRPDIFHAYHDDLGHQGRDRTLSILKRRFFWQGMDKYVQNMVRQCKRCICRKTAPTTAAELVNIISTAPMELVCIDYLSLETSKGGFENILVITDHFSRYAQAIPTRNQTARTTARVLVDNFFVHYGFPAKLHSDKGANFESKTIKKLCQLAGMKKSRTTPYHPMGNGMVERFNRTLLNMMGTLTDSQKRDWKAHVPSLTHAYNAAVHDSTGYSPFYLMFGRHPRLAIDAFLGISQEDTPRSHMDYADQLKCRLDTAYQLASDEARKTGKRYKRYYDTKVKHASLKTGDRVLVRKVGLKGKQKLADKWETEPYIVVDQPMPDIPVFKVRPENTTARCRLLHRNMLLPFMYLPCQDRTGRAPTRRDHSRDRNCSDSDVSSTTNDESHDDTDDEEPVGTRQRRYRTRQATSTDVASDVLSDVVSDGDVAEPQHDVDDMTDLSQRSSRTSSVRASSRSPSPRHESGRPVRRRRPPEWLRSDDWVTHAQYTFEVPASDVVYL